MPNASDSRPGQVSAKVRKAIVPAAGLGTRFLPATKTVPKEMLPIVDRPIILHIVEEAARAGIEDIVLIAGRGKGAIEDFFDVSFELESKLVKDGKQEWAEDLRRIRLMANVISIRQHEARGLGHAVYCGRPIVGDEPFAVLLGDEIMVSAEGQPNVTQTLAHSFESTGISTVAVMEVPVSETSKYGVVEGDSLSERPATYGGEGPFMRVRNVIEKPAPGQTSSRWALPGRYVFSSEIFRYLENAKPGKNGEIQLTDAMTQLARGPGLYASTFGARRFDAGDKLGFLQANVELALDRPELAEPLRAYIKALASRL